MTSPREPVPIFHVDAFTPEPFRGNPAAVCLLREERDAEWMQAVAADMNLSETAFVAPLADAEFALRWFTPTIEVPLCGHATLASAHALWESGAVEPGRAATFHTKKSGRLAAARHDAWIELDFPALVVSEAEPPASVRAALRGAAVTRVSALPRETYGEDAYLVELDSARAVRELEPDLDPLRAPDAPGLIVTAAGDRDFDFVSRFFCPFAGIDEDPVTGSAHCALAPYWARRLGRAELVGFQASPRGGVVGVRHEGDRVALRGQAVTVLRGTLQV